MLVINLYGLRRVIGADEAITRDEDLTGTEKQVKSLLLHFLAGCLNAFLLPVYTMDQYDTLIQYFAMPASKYFLFFSEKYFIYWDYLFRVPYYRYSPKSYLYSVRVRGLERSELGGSHGCP